MTEDDSLKKIVIDSSIDAIKVSYAEGRLFEQERIIKLLEENWVEPMDWLSVIALIKGEQK